MRGFEPPTPGTTIQCSNQLSYIHHPYVFNLAISQIADKTTHSQMTLPSPRVKRELFVQGRSRQFNQKGR